jgi:hypothetical protein
MTSDIAPDHIGLARASPDGRGKAADQAGRRPSVMTCDGPLQAGDRHDRSAEDSDDQVTAHHGYRHVIEERAVVQDVLKDVDIRVLGEGC